MIDAEQIFMEIVSSKSVPDKWTDSKHEDFRGLANSMKGDAGEEFTKKYAIALGFNVSITKRLGDYDVIIENKKFEVKLATEDVNKSFQFNHIRYDSKYHFLLCIGVRPNKLLFNAWTKADVTTGVAGNLVSMGKNQNSSFKLTKRIVGLKCIDTFKEHISNLLKM